MMPQVLSMHLREQNSCIRPVNEQGTTFSSTRRFGFCRVLGLIVCKAARGSPSTSNKPLAQKVKRLSGMLNVKI
jgi:hypothetical protein